MKNLIAHRGLKDESKENTLQAFTKSLENPNYQGFECDVRTSKDNVFVVCHDALIGISRVSSTNYEELKRKYNIPTLESVLKLQTDKIMLLEIKETNLDIERFNKLLKKYAKKNIYVMSFFNTVIQKLHEKKCPCKLGVLNYVLNSEENYQEYQFICLLESIVSKKLVIFFHEKNMEVFIYGIHHFKETQENYQDCYLITDEIVK